MSIFEYDEEATRRAIRDNAYERGVEDGESKGRINDILQLLEDTGLIPEKLREEIMSETDNETLKKWLRIAAKAESIEDFLAKMPAKSRKS